MLYFTNNSIEVQKLQFKSPEMPQKGIYWSSKIKKFVTVKM